MEYLATGVTLLNNKIKNKSFLRSHDNSISRPLYNKLLSSKECIIVARTRVETLRFNPQHFCVRT